MLTIPRLVQLSIFYSKQRLSMEKKCKKMHTKEQRRLLRMKNETVVEEEFDSTVWSTGAMFSVADKLCWVQQPQMSIETFHT